MAGDRQTDRTRRRFDWVRRKVLDDSKDAKESFLFVTNPRVTLPNGIQHYPEFVSVEDEREINAEIDDGQFRKEGFDMQRRVQRFRLSAGGEARAENDDSKVPRSLQRLNCRLAEATGLVAQFATVEDMPILGSGGLVKGEFASNRIVTTFESSHCCPDDCGGCFVAYVPIGKSAVQHWNRPLRRSPSCWSLQSPDHWTDVRIDRGSLLVRKGDCLHNWRSRFVATLDDLALCSDNVWTHDTVRVVKFYTLPDNPGTTTRRSEDEEDAFGYIPRPGDMIGRQCPMPPLQDLLTVIITTSPVRSNPSTELLERALDTLSHGGAEFAYKCRKVIVCGTCGRSIGHFDSSSVLSNLTTRL